MTSKRGLLASLIAGGVAVGGAAALINAPGAPVTHVSLAGASSGAPATASLTQEITSLTLQEKQLQTAIAAARQKLATTVASTNAAASKNESELSGEAQQLASRQAAISQEASQLGAERNTLAQDAAKLSAQQASPQAVAPAVHATTGASGASHGDGGGGGGDN